MRWQELSSGDCQVERRQLFKLVLLFLDGNFHLVACLCHFFTTAYLFSATLSLILMNPPLANAPKCGGFTRRRVSVSFQQKYPPGSVLRCPTAAENRVMTKGVVSGGGWPPSPAYNVEPVTNTSSSSSCANNGDGRRRECSAWRRPSRLYFSHFATRRVYNTVE